jgi:hypothetical protein
MKSDNRLAAIRFLHTVVWAFFVACILLIPVAAQAGRFGLAALLIGFVLLEVLVLAVNHWRCPLTGIAARHTDDRQANFDIFLPLWLARHNKTIFGSLFVAGLAYTAFEWFRRGGGA